MSINIIERAIVPYNATGSSVIFNNQYHMFAPVAGINKVGMAGYNDDFSISTSQIVSISDKFKASGLQYTDVSNLPANIVYAIDGIKSPNVVFSGYEHDVQNPTPGETGNITVKGSLLTTYSNYTDTDNYSMNEILFADGRIWFRELDIVDGVVYTMTAFKISYSKDEVDSYFRTKGDSYTITQINAFLALKVNLAGAETITGKKTFSAGLSTSIAPTVGNDVVNKTYADLKVALAGTETITGKKTFSAGLDTYVAPAAGADIVNKTYADSKVPKTAIQTRVSGTPLDSNVLSEKFVNTTYRTKADSWSKANLDAHIGALETRVGDEVLSASLPGNEFGQGTLSGIINTLGSHIDSLQLGFVPRTMRNIITPLRSKNPTDLSTTDSYDEIIALSEVGFVPDIPVGQTMTLVDRINAFVLADQGRAANHTDAVVCVDIQAPDRGRLITYYYWDLGTGDEYEGVPAGWYVADVNMSPDNITNIGAFTKLLSKTPVGYDEDSTGTRVFAVNGSWKKYSAADLHAIYPTLEYLGLLDLWFIILAPDVDTMNTINNYEPGKSVALVDCAHGMGIDSAIGIDLLKKVKDVESGSLIQNIQYCKFDQFHVLSNGLVVLYADDPFDGEVVIKTGKAYYVSGATEMMNVPMSQVTGLELALDLKTDIADIIGDEATETVKSAEHAITADKYNQNDSTEGSIKSKFNSVDSALDDKVNIADIQNVQSALTNKVPSSNLLKESSFARVYREKTDFTYDNATVTFPDFAKLLTVNFSKVAIRLFAVDVPLVKPIAASSGTLYLTRVAQDAIWGKWVSSGRSTTDLKMYNYETYIATNDTDDKWCGWKQVLTSPDSIETTQSTSELNVPSSKLLKESSFARVYRSLTELAGITTSSTIEDVATAMQNNSMLNCELTTAYTNIVPPNLYPHGYLRIYRVRDVRITCELWGKDSGSNKFQLFVGVIKLTDSTKWTGWKQVIDDSTAQTITGIKTFATDATPLITDQPTTNLMAANKAYVDTTTINPNILTNANFLVNDLGEASYTSPSTTTINNWGFGTASGVTGSYTVTTKKLKCDYSPISTSGKFVNLQQYIPNPSQFNGKTITFSVKAISTTGNWLIHLWRTPSGGTTTNLGQVSVWNDSLLKSLTINVGATDIAPTDTMRVVIQSYSEVELEYAKLEVGSIATAFSPAPNTMLITASPTSDSMAVNKYYVDGLLATYDKVIRTQDEFEDMIEDSDWLDAKSVALVGQFTLSKASGIEIPATVKQIHGFNGAKITITDFVYHATTAKGGLWYDIAPTTQDYNIRDLEVSLTGIGSSVRAFYNCIGLHGCVGTGSGGTACYGFFNCDYITNCRSTGTGGTSGYGFRDCYYITNCTGDGTGEANGYGFFNCYYITNCRSTGTSGTSGYGFHDCDYITNCTGDGTGEANGYGFRDCGYITNCRGTGIDSGDESDGFGFYNITRASNCRDGGSNTNMWAGTNKDIDYDTCCKNASVSPVNNSTLNT